MKLFRYSAPLFILCAVLAACGGGGGGGGVTPPGGGGGGGGGTPTPSPSHSGSPSPTSSPTVQPSPTATPTGGGVPVDKTYALNAQVGPQSNPPPPLSNQLWYTSGTTALWNQLPNEPNVTAFGDTMAGASETTQWPQEDGMNCSPLIEVDPGKYAVHSFVGIYYNNGGSWEELQLPSGIGMRNPTEPSADPSNPPNSTDYYQIQSDKCEYNVHTHDFSGLVHIVDNNVNQSTSPNSPLPYKPTLKSLFDIWGITYSANGITIPNQGTLTGSVAYYYGTQGGDSCQNNSTQTDSYMQVSDPTQVPLAYHDTAMVVIGSGFPLLPTGKNALPSVCWEVEY